MQDLYLSFFDEATAKAVLFTEVPTEFDTEGNVTASTSKPNYHNADVIGIIYKPTGEIDAEGNPVMAALDGWHVNVRLAGGEDDSVLGQYAVTPTTPVRVWS